MSLILCPSCGKENAPNEAKCAGCGAALESTGLVRPGTRWSWVGLSFAIMIASWFVLTLVASRLPEPYTTYVPIASWFLGGLVAGRLSTGTTITEPALGAAGAILALAAFLLVSGRATTIEALLGAAIGGILALGGALVGEKLQGTI